MIWKILAAAGLAFSLCAAGCGHAGRNTSEPGRAQEPDLVHEIRNCSRIYTSEFRVSKIVVERDEKRIKGTFAGIPLNIGIAGTERVAAIPIKGVLKGYVDLSDFDEKNIRRRGDSIEILLPDPSIMLTSTRIASSEIKEKSGLFRGDLSDEELTALQRAGRDSLIAEIPKLDIVGNVRLSAARTLMALLTSLGYDRDKIAVTFSTDERTLSSPARLKDMIVSSLNEPSK